MAQHRKSQCTKTERTRMETLNKLLKLIALPKREPKQKYQGTTVKLIILGCVVISNMHSLAHAEASTETWCSEWKKENPKRHCKTLTLKAGHSPKMNWELATFDDYPKDNDDLKLPLSSIEVRVGKRDDNQRSHRFTATIHLATRLAWDSKSDMTTYEGRTVSSVKGARLSNSRTGWMNANLNEAVGLGKDTILPREADFEVVDIVRYYIEAERISGTGGYVDIRWTLQ
jgi:hypothetical protein